MKRIPAPIAVMVVVLLALAPGAALMHPAASAAETITVDTSSVATKLARHLQVAPDRIPATVPLATKHAAVVCNVTLGDLRASPSGRCTATEMSQGLIQAVRQAMRGG